jgi:hypothetical protein
VPKVFEDGANDAQHVWIVDGVVYLAPVPPVANEAKRAQHPKLMRDRRGRHLEPARQIKHTRLAVGHRVKDTNARGIPQRPKHVRQRANLVVRKGTPPDQRDPCVMIVLVTTLPSGAGCASSGERTLTSTLANAPHLTPAIH